MADIKTRDTVKGTIKTIDKAVVASQRMKQAYISTKEKAEYSTHALLIRLRELGMLEYHDISEYISTELNLGGGMI